MKKCLFFFFLFLSFGTTAQEPIYVLFTINPPKATFRMEPTTREKNVIGYFYLSKDNEADCPFNFFIYDKYTSTNSLIEVKTDTLKSVITSEWVATQPDTTLIKLFRGKNIYVIPKDSLKNNVGNAYLVTYDPCADI